MLKPLLQKSHKINPQKNTTGKDEGKQKGKKHGQKGGGRQPSIYADVNVITPSDGDWLVASSPWQPKYDHLLSIYQHELLSDVVSDLIFHQRMMTTDQGLDTNRQSNLLDTSFR